MLEYGAYIVASLWGGFAATRVIARTATDIRNGGSSPLAGLVRSIRLVAVLLVLSLFSVNIPLASLAAKLFVIAWDMSEAIHNDKMIY